MSNDAFAVVERAANGLAEIRRLVVRAPRCGFVGFVGFVVESRLPIECGARVVLEVVRTGNEVTMCSTVLVNETVGN